MAHTHTPGPWEYVPDEDIPGHREPDRVKAGKYWILQTNSSVSYVSNETTANARLIAAAPDLLAALELLVSDCADYPAWERPCMAVDHARAAIRKARGEVQS